MPPSRHICWLKICKRSAPMERALSLNGSRPGDRQHREIDLASHDFGFPASNLVRTPSTTMVVGQMSCVEKKLREESMSFE